MISRKRARRPSPLSFILARPYIGSGYVSRHARESFGEQNREPPGVMVRYDGRLTPSTCRHIVSLPRLFGDGLHIACP
jgi:hypothetical protein